MKKRIISFLICVNLLVLTLCGRLFTLAAEPESASTQSSTRVKEIDTKRGTIYDRSLVPLVNNAYKEKLIIPPTDRALSYLKANGYGDEIIKNVVDGYLTITESRTNSSLPEGDDLREIKAFERYSDSTLLHLIGYIDESGDGVCGIEKHFNQYLKDASGTISVVYSTDATGRMLLNEGVEIRNEGYYNKTGIVLTIDKNIQGITENALKNNGIRTGAAIVTDTRSGEILACASVPVYDRDNLSDYITRTDSPFINRAFTAYPLGSIFKIVTSAAALESGTEITEFYCNGSIIKSGTTFNCSKLDGHGYINFDTAIAKSCNPYFIDLGIKAGSEAITETARRLGFGKETDLGNGMVADSGILPTIDELNSDASVGNLSFGQGKLTATPLQVASLMTIIANDGYSKEPKLIAGFTDDKGNFTPNLESASAELLKRDTCHKLKGAMAETVISGTGKAAFSSLYTCCTKTATAQSGQYNEDGTEVMYCWLAGFFPAENPRYAICVMNENGVSGGGDCGPVFKEIAESIITLERTNANKNNTTDPF
ncbi:MAG: penicillin-binding protein 2 [Clostridia bacterium]|nr:penicillin-binding protein 2 [Clostridia bacterium]